MSTTAAVGDLLAFLRQEVLEKGAATGFDLLLFEVNGDTGRLIAAATTSRRHDAGNADGCSLRLQLVQDAWYDLLEGGASDAELSAGALQMVYALGIAFRDNFTPHLKDLLQMSSSNGFTYRVFGSEPGPIYEEQFSTT